MLTTMDFLLFFPGEIIIILISKKSRGQEYYVWSIGYWGRRKNWNFICWIFSVSHCSFFHFCSTKYIFWGVSRLKISGIFINHKSAKLKHNLLSINHQNFIEAWPHSNFEFSSIEIRFSNVTFSIFL